ncbi:MAG: BolA protein [Pseudohongiellaceae bacterium]|jgi:BolA protein
MKIQQQIEQTLQTAFTPTFLEVINESDGHNVPRGSESHFKVIIVSDVFINTSRIKRHKMIYSAAAAEVEQVHAFSVSAFDISEWSVKKGEVAQSPPCLGGEN